MTTSPDPAGDAPLFDPFTATGPMVDALSASRPEPVLGEDALRRLRILGYRPEGPPAPDLRDGVTG